MMKVGIKFWVKPEDVSAVGYSTQQGSDERLILYLTNGMEITVATKMEESVKSTLKLE